MDALGIVNGKQINPQSLGVLEWSENRVLKSMQKMMMDGLY